MLNECERGESQVASIEMQVRSNSTRLLVPICRSRNLYCYGSRGICSTTNSAWKVEYSRMSRWLERCETIYQRDRAHHRKKLFHRLRSLILRLREKQLRCAFDKFRSVLHAQRPKICVDLAKFFASWRTSCRERRNQRCVMIRLSSRLSLKLKREGFRQLHCFYAHWKTRSNYMCLVLKRFVLRCKYRRALLLVCKLSRRSRLLAVLRKWSIFMELLAAEESLNKRAIAYFLMQTWLRFSDGIRTQRAIRNTLSRLSQLHCKQLVLKHFWRWKQVSPPPGRTFLHKHTFPRKPCDYVKLNYKARRASRDSHGEAFRVALHNDARKLSFHENQEKVIRNRIHDCNFLVKKLQRQPTGALSGARKQRASLWRNDETILTLGFERRQHDLVATKSYWI